MSTPSFVVFAHTSLDMFRHAATSTPYKVPCRLPIIYQHIGHHHLITPRRFVYAYYDAVTRFTRAGEERRHCCRALLRHDVLRAIVDMPRMLRSAVCRFMRVRRVYARV